MGTAFAALVVIAMAAVDVVGSPVVAYVRSVVGHVLLGMLITFTVVTVVGIAPSGYPSPREIVSVTALTFVTVTAKDIVEPVWQLPWTMYLAFGMAAGVYVATGLGVFDLTWPG